MDELFAIKLQKAQLLAQKVELIKRNGLEFYRPHAGQDSFHAAGAKVRRRYVRTGNRFGKSTAGCAEDVAWLLGERCWYKHPFDIKDREGKLIRRHEGGEHHPLVRGGIPQHPVKLLTTGADWDKISEVWTNEQDGKVWRFLPQGLVRKVHRNSVGCICKIDCVNGSSWTFESVKGFKYDQQSAESSDWDAIHYDEPLPEKMRKALARGLIDRGGHEWFTLTPLTEFWINDYFFPSDTAGKPRSDVWTLCGNTYDNIYLNAENIAAYEADLNEDERQCRIEGLPLELAGLVYKEFKWDKHVLADVPYGWGSFLDPAEDHTIYYAIDPHPRKPHAILYCAISPYGIHHYFCDYFKSGIASDLADNILDVLRSPRGFTRRLGRGIMDPLGFIDEPSTKTNMQTELADLGIYVDKAVKSLDHGIIRVKGQLKAPGAIFFTPNCARTLWEIQRYCWDSEKERPVDDNDHMMENLYRMELSEMRWIDPEWSKIVVDPIVIDRPELDLEDISFSD